MPSIDEVYRKFGEVSEAAQLLETELGTMLIETRCVEENLLFSPDQGRAKDVFAEVNRSTLGQVLRQLKISTDSLDVLHQLLREALVARNHLAHSFYREHNLRTNSEEGRVVMLEELEVLHQTLLSAYREVLLLTTGIDIFRAQGPRPPEGHLPL